MDQIPLYAVGVVLTIAVLYIQSRLIGAMLGFLIGGMHCFIHDLRGWNTTPVLALCMLGGILLAGTLRQKSSSDDDKNFFEQCCDALRMLAENDFNITTEDWTNVRTYSLGKTFISFMISNPEPSRILSKCDFSEGFTWALSTSFLAGFLNVRTGRLEYGLAQEKDSQIRTVVEQQFQDVAHVSPHKFFNSMFLTLVKIISDKSSKEGRIERVKRNGMRVCDGMRAAFHLGCAVATGISSSKSKNTVFNSEKSKELLTLITSEISLFEECCKKFNNISDNYNIQTTGWTDDKMISFGAKFANMMLSKNAEIYSEKFIYGKIYTYKLAYEIVSTSILAGISIANNERFEIKSDFFNLEFDSPAKLLAKLELRSFFLSKTKFYEFFKEICNLFILLLADAEKKSKYNGIDDLIRMPMIVRGEIRALFQLGVAMEFGKTRKVHRYSLLKSTTDDKGIKKA